MGEVEALSITRRRDLVRALRSGTVPERGLEHLAVGLDPIERALGNELRECTTGRGLFKALRGEYGTGKTFASRYFGARALSLGMAATEVQVSEVDTPLYRLETVYRRALEHLRTAEWDRGAFRQIVERWFFDLEEAALAAEPGLGEDGARLHERVAGLLDARLEDVTREQPTFSAALRAAHRARTDEDRETFDGLVAWLMGQPHVAASIKRKAGVKADLDHTGALAFLRGLLVLLRQTGRPGLFFVLDEVETIQRVRADSREKSLNALRQLMDAIAGGQYPGLYLLITGTGAFFDGPQGVRRLPPLHARLHVEFDADARFDNARAVQVRLSAFDAVRLREVARRVRALFPAEHPERIAAKVTDAVIDGLASGIVGQLGGRTGVAPRLFLKKLVDLMDRVDAFAEFDPVAHFGVKVSPAELTAEEAEAAGVERGLDDIALELPRKGAADEEGAGGA